MQEMHRRSIAKGVSWRVFATADTIFLALIFTGSVASALSIGGLELLTKTLWYYAHERAWLHAAPTDAESRFGKLFNRGTHAHSVIKGVSWRAVGALDTFLISLIITGRLAISGSIGATELITKVGLYYLHERLWMHIRWGLVAPEPEAGEFSRIKDAMDVIRNYLRLGTAIFYAVACFLFVLASAGAVYLLHAAWR
jgi:uncharacterized membrane protein